MVAIGATTVFGAAGLALGTERAGAQADITMGELAVSDATFSPEDGALNDVYVVVSGEYSYKVNTDPADWQVYLLIGDGSGGTEAIGLTDGAASARDGSGSYSLSGSVTAASFYDASTFALAEGESQTSVALPVTVVFLVRDAAGQTIIQARESDTATVTVDDANMPRVQIGAVGELRAQDDAGDPKPEA